MTTMWMLIRRSLEDAARAEALLAQPGTRRRLALEGMAVRREQAALAGRGAAAAVVLPDGLLLELLPLA